MSVADPIAVDDFYNPPLGKIRIPRILRGAIARLLSRR